MTKKQAAQLFGCSLDRLNEQYADNLKEIKVMHAKAIQTGKKVNGHTAEQLSEMVAKLERTIAADPDTDTANI